MDQNSLSQFDQTARRVFLAHGWDTQVINKIKEVLAILGLCVIEWEELVARTGKPAPFTLPVVREALILGVVCVILFTPDETLEVASHVKRTLLGSLHANRTSFQARPNVLIEAGMALAINEQRTVIVLVGQHRQISDLDGLNVVRTSDKEWAVRFAQRLRIAFDNADLTLELNDDLLATLRMIKPMGLD